MRHHERARKDPARSEDERRPDVPGPAADVLALQRTAGNRAVGALLARQPKPAAPKEKPKEPAPVTGNRVVFPGIGTIPVESVQMGGGRNITNPSGTGSGREGGAPAISEIVITSLQGEHSTALFRASLDGKGADVEVILESGKQKMVLKLKNALVSSYSVSGHGGDKPLESWTLNFTAIEFEHQGQEKTDEQTGAGWDLGTP